MPNRWKRRAALPNAILAWAALAGAALLAAGCTSSSAAGQPGAPARPQPCSPVTAPTRPAALQTKVRIIIITGNATPNDR